MRFSTTFVVEFEAESEVAAKGFSENVKNGLASLEEVKFATANSPYFMPVPKPPAPRPVPVVEPIYVAPPVPTPQPTPPNLTRFVVGYEMRTLKDYEEAPNGTQVPTASFDGVPWTKRYGCWGGTSTAGFFEMVRFSPTPVRKIIAIGG